jgi:hypothetical protein
MSNRFKSENAIELVKHLVESGIDATAKVAKADTSLHGGCTDPDCCPQGSFPGMLSVVSNLTDTQLHKEAVLAGIVPPKNDRDRRRLRKQEAQDRADYYRAVLEEMEEEGDR